MRPVACMTFTAYTICISLSVFCLFKLVSFFFHVFILLLLCCLAHHSVLAFEHLFQPLAHLVQPPQNVFAQ